MFSDTITFEDFNGKQCSETLFFNISKLETLELQKSKDFHYEEYLQRVLESLPEDDTDEAENMKALYSVLDVLKDLMHYGYGEKSEDGKRFIKSEELYTNFEHSAVYEEFVIKLLSHPDYTLKFITAVLPDVGLSAEDVKAEIESSSEETLNDRMRARIEAKKTEANIIEVTPSN